MPLTLVGVELQVEPSSPSSRVSTEIVEIDRNSRREGLRSVAVLAIASVPTYHRTLVQSQAAFLALRQNERLSLYIDTCSRWHVQLSAGRVEPNDVLS